MAIGGGGVVGQVAYLAFNAVAMPVLAVGAGAVLFFGAMDKIHDVMCFRALNGGQVTVKTQRRPKIAP